MPEYEDLPEAAIIDDFAHQETDRILSRTEKQIAKEYRQAEKELTAKIKKFGEQFDKKDEEMKQKMLDGKITKEQYSNWRVSMIATGDRWVAMRDTLAEDIARANDIAKSTINGHMEQVYSLNRNYSVYKVEKDSMIDTSYTLYNRRATEELFKNKKSLLPAPKPGSKAWKAAHDKDLRWNQQKINSSMIQGLLQGESIPQIAKRMREVVGMNKRAAIRNARTMTTNIENKGRDDAFKELRGKGIEMDTVWVSTLDGRTRHSHRLLHGEIRDEKTGKYSNKLRFPGDEQGAPEEVYNCRCCEISTIKGFPIDIPRWSPKMEGMTYEEWLGEHEKQTPKSEKSRPVATNRKEANEILSKFFNVEENTKYIDEGLFVDATNRITELNDRFGAIKENNVGFISSSNQNAVASCGSSFRHDQVRLFLCKDYYSDPNYLVKKEQEMKDKKWSMPFKDGFERIYTVTHEYGHAFQSVLARSYIDLEQFEVEFKKRLKADTYGKKAKKYQNDTEKKAAKEMWSEIVGIAKERNSNFSVSENLSDYGKSNYFEAFAETFANALCGAPNELGEAMNIWLERKGF